jgi:hypothetical protein
MVTLVTTTWSWPPAPVLRQDASWLGQSADDQGAEAVDECDGADETRDEARGEARDDADDEDVVAGVAGASAGAFASPVSVVPPPWLPAMVSPTETATATARVPTTIRMPRCHFRGPFPVGRSDSWSLMSPSSRRGQIPRLNA